MKIFTNCKTITSQKFSVCGSYLHSKRKADVIRRTVR